MYIIVLKKILNIFTPSVRKFEKTTTKKITKKADQVSKLD